MQECTRHDLRAAREAAKMPRWKLAQDVGVSEGTVRAWEDGESQPTPDDVLKIVRATGADVLIWWRWMRSTYESCRELLPPRPLTNSLLASVTNARHQMGDVTALISDIERDSIDGHIDDRTKADAMIKEASEAAAALLGMITNLELKGGS